MGRTISLGRIRGIEIGAHWTWFLVFALISYSLAVGVFPDQNPGLSDGAYWAMGVIAALLFFTSILLHELGHALQALRDRVEIDGITLWLFGGVARFKGMYESPGAEFRIAIAGPLVTLVIATVLIGGGSLVSLPEGIEGVVFWLGYINAIVLVFNLLPALPLDGGRLLHSALWRARNNLLWATRVGTAIGVAFGYGMIGGGIFLAFGGFGFGGLWLAVLGWFLVSAAQAEAQQIEARGALGHVKVSELMATEPVSVEPGTSIGRFVDEIAHSTRFTTYPVVDHDRPVGLLTFRCVAQVPRERWDEEMVRDCMIAGDEVPVVRPDQDAADALAELAGSPLRRALVVEDGRLVGLLSITDVARAVELGRRNGSGAPRHS